MEKNKELTPMMELLEDLKETKITAIETLNDIDDLHVRECCQISVTKTLDCIIDRIESELLPKEKQVIEDAYDDGWMNCNAKKYDSGETYYNTKYNNQIK